MGHIIKNWQLNDVLTVEESEREAIITIDRRENLSAISLVVKTHVSIIDSNQDDNFEYRGEAEAFYDLCVSNNGQTTDASIPPRYLFQFNRLKTRDSFLYDALCENTFPDYRLEEYESQTKRQYLQLQTSENKESASGELTKTNKPSISKVDERLAKQHLYSAIKWGLLALVFAACVAIVCAFLGPVGLLSGLGAGPGFVWAAMESRKNYKNYKSVTTNKTSNFPIVVDASSCSEVEKSTPQTTGVGISHAQVRTSLLIAPSAANLSTNEPSASQTAPVQSVYQPNSTSDLRNGHGTFSPTFSQPQYDEPNIVVLHKEKAEFKNY